MSARFGEWRPRPPRYVVADVDGTLLAGRATATPGVVAAVRDARAAGLRVGFATGRLPAGVQRLERQLELDGPHVVHNGAQVIDGGRAVRTWPLPRGTGTALARMCLERGWYAEFYLDDRFVVTDRRAAARPAWDAITGEPHGLVADVDLATVRVVKATVVAFTPAELPEMLGAVRRLGLVADSAPTLLVSGMHFVNANSAAADKGSGVRYATGRHGIALDELVAVGDGINDLSMLAIAGTAIAMGQAARDVRDAAHIIVPEVEEDGVAHALRAAAAWRRRLPPPFDGSGRTPA